MASEIATLPANSFVFVAAFDSNEMMPYQESASSSEIIQSKSMRENCYGPE
jgi:hypothetical protein